MTLKDFDHKGWKINSSDLVLPKDTGKHFNSTPTLFETSDGRFACLFYLIGEYRMMCYAGLISIYANKSAPKKIFNPDHWFDYEFDSSVFFCGDYLFARQLEMYNKETKNVYAPFIVFDLISLSVSLIDFDFTSIYYSIKQIDTNKIALRLKNPSELSSLTVKVENRDGNIIDLKGLDFRPLTDFEPLMTEYSRTKNGY